MLPYLQDLYAWFTSDYTDIIKRVTTNGMSNNADFNELLHHGTAEDLTKARANTDPKVWESIKKANSYSTSNFDAWTGGIGAAQKKIGDSDQESALLDLLNKNNGVVDKTSYLGARPETHGGRRVHLDWDDKSAMFDKTVELYKSMHTNADSNGSPNNVEQKINNKLSPTTNDDNLPLSNYESQNVPGGINPTSPPQVKPVTPPSTYVVSPADDNNPSDSQGVDIKNPTMENFDKLINTQIKTNDVLDKLTALIQDGISINIDGKKLNNVMTRISNSKTMS
jgi:hypothetical protein